MEKVKCKCGKLAIPGHKCPICSRPVPKMVEEPIIIVEDLNPVDNDNPIIDESYDEEVYDSGEHYNDRTGYDEPEFGDNTSARI